MHYQICPLLLSKFGSDVHVLFLRPVLDRSRASSCVVLCIYRLVCKYKKSNMSIPDTIWILRHVFVFIVAPQGPLVQRNKHRPPWNIRRRKNGEEATVDEEVLASLVAERADLVELAEESW